MKKIALFIIEIYYTLFSPISAQVGWKSGENNIYGYEARTFEKKGFSSQLPYRFFTPEQKTGIVKFPLVIFMHGAGKAQGADNISQLIHGSILFVADEVQEKYPCFVVAPQCTSDVWWVNVKPPSCISPEINAVIKKEKNQKVFRIKARNLMNDPDLYFPLDISDIPEPLQMVSALIDEIIEKYPVDRDRIYITGGSMGGLTTWCLAFMNPERPAAIAPFCSPSDPENARLLRNIPIWIFHGDKDDYFPVKSSRDIYKSLIDVGNKEVKYTEIPGVSHGGLSTKAYNQDNDKDGEVDIVTWLFSQRRKLYKDRTNTDLTIKNIPK